MLIEAALDFPASLAFLQESIFHHPSGDELARIVVRWIHFVAGITWIGLLYFFNLVNVPLMKALDAPTKGKVIPELLPRALWYFRWGALVTVLAGLTYYAMYILKTDADNSGQNTFVLLLKWLVIVLASYAVLYFLYNIPALTKDGRVLAIVVAILVLAMSWIMLSVMGTVERDGATYVLSNKSLSIGVGGGIGILMLLNVWGIIWPAQKRIINWTRANAADGTPIPPESAALARRAFLASRTNAWLSLPMLFLMGTSHGDYVIFGGQ
jgi:uncharacterized membrane protein